MSRSRGTNVGSQRQELVFCHECENEFYKTGANGLTCPACHSDFTEVIEPDFDPRAANEPQHLLHNHNPWTVADDPEEDDIDQFSARRNNDPPHMPMPGAFFGGGIGRSPNAPQQQQQNPFPTAMFGPLTSLFETIQGQRNTPPAMSMPNQGGIFGANFRPQSAPGGRHTGHTYTSQPAPGVHVSFTTRTYGGHGQAMAPIDMNEIMNGLFGNIAGGGSARGQPGVPPSFATFLNSMFDPANAAQGDAVFSQEALDRVISQLMEQHPGGSAPGPATESAISSLPKKKLSVDLLDETTGEAECSICMDNVGVGEEVTFLPCGHWFHFPCVEAWLKEHDTCPVCRQGIMPKDGSRDTVRDASQAPLHDEGPGNVGRRQSGTRDHPFVVAESPTRARRRPSHARRHSSTAEGSGGGITDRVRSFFGGGGGGSGGGGATSGSGNNGSGWRQG